MSTNPFESLPPAPDDLWPKVSSSHPSTEALASERFPTSLADMAGILDRRIHREMQSSGECAAKAVMPPANLPPRQSHLHGVEQRFHARFHAESAARLLHFYTVLHTEAVRQRPVSLPSPSQLKDAATRTYQIAVRDELTLQHQIEVLKVENPGFNDELFGQLKNKALGQSAKHRR
jgi:hypothetical protein